MQKVNKNTNANEQCSESKKTTVVPKIDKELRVAIDRLSETQIRNIQSRYNAKAKIELNEMVPNETTKTPIKKIQEKKQCTEEKKTKGKKRVQGKRKEKLSLKERILNDAPENEYFCDEIVLVTIPGFCPWPARIISMSGETILVEFFGTGQRYAAKKYYCMVF